MRERGGGGWKRRGWPPWRQPFEMSADEEREAARRAAEGEPEAGRGEGHEARAKAPGDAHEARVEASRTSREERAEASREARAEQARTARESRWADRMRRRERAREVARQFEENLLFEIEREWQRWMPSAGDAEAKSERGAKADAERDGGSEVEGERGGEGSAWGGRGGGQEDGREGKRGGEGSAWGGRGGGHAHDRDEEDDGGGDDYGDEWDGPIWRQGRRFGGPHRPRFGRRAGPFPRPPWARRPDEAEQTQQWLAWMERMEQHRARHDRHFRRERFRRRPWVWWLHAKLRQKIFVWLGLAITIGLFAGGYLGRSGGSRGWMVLVVFLISWVGSGVIAWRMTRPLMMVVDAARAIGAGKLDTRIAVRGSGEVAILGTAINDMATRISAQLAEQRQLLAAVSHELRTPLGHLRVLLETARERGLPAPLFEQLEREVLDLDDLVGKLLASSRLEFGQLERKPIELGELVAEAALNAGVAVEAISAEGSCQAQVDPTLVRRAVANLLDNAARHGGGAVAARVRGGDGEVTVEIDDAGPGVPAERRADAFSAFVPSAAGGLGLGLALVQRIAAAHRGSAWIADRPGGGARVGFSVAREMAPSRAPEEVRERASEKPTHAPGD